MKAVIESLSKTRLDQESCSKVSGIAAKKDVRFAQFGAKMDT